MKKSNKKMWAKLRLFLFHTLFLGLLVYSLYGNYNDLIAYDNDIGEAEVSVKSREDEIYYKIVVDFGVTKAPVSVRSINCGVSLGTPSGPTFYDELIAFESFEETAENECTYEMYYSAVVGRKLRSNYFSSIDDLKSSPQYILGINMHDYIIKGVLVFDGDNVTHEITEIERVSSGIFFYIYVLIKIIVLFCYLIILLRLIFGINTQVDSLNFGVK